MAKENTPTQNGSSPSDDSDKPNSTPKATSNPPPKQPFLQRLKSKSKLNTGILIMMLKFSLPPTIALSIYQDTGASQIYSTLGYLPAIISVLSLAILPRSKFIQTMLLNCIGACIGFSVLLLQIYCSVQARKHTTPPMPPGTPPPKTVPYNSSACAVSAIWLFFTIYVVNMLRASRPQLQIPVIIYSIFANVGSVYAPSFPTMELGIPFAERLIECFTTGFGIATGVSLLVIPISVRKAWFGQAAGLIGALQKALNCQASYFEALEDSNMFDKLESEEDAGHGGKTKKSRKEKAPHSLADDERRKLKEILYGIGELTGKMQGDIVFAKRELGWGKLDASDIDELFRLLQGVLLPLMGLASTSDIFHRLAEKWGWGEHASEKNIERQDAAEVTKAQWNEVMVLLHEPLGKSVREINEGLTHVLYALQLAKPPKKKKKGEADVEADAGTVKPGNVGFGDVLARNVEQIHQLRKSAIETLCQRKGVRLDEIKTTFNPKRGPDIHTMNMEDDSHHTLKGQIYIILYVDHLLYTIGKAVQDLSEFADRKVSDGTMKKNRLITPTYKRLKKWLLTLLKHDNSSTEHTPDSAESGRTVNVRTASRSKDPEHLEPTTWWQRQSNILRKFGDLLASQESAFGFRVACATMSIGIIAYLERTRVFFLDQRLVWAMIMVAIGMTVTAGSGVYGFAGRIAGTFLAMCTSLVIWYIVNGHTAGVIVFTWLFIFVEAYFFLVYPKFVVVSLLAIVTQVLILGYELEVNKVGAKVATSNGQPAYHTYLLAPYRLATVTAGMAVAFFWTFFPYPILSRSQLRRDLGTSLYLLANYGTIVRTTYTLRIRGLEGDLNAKENPGRKLKKARMDIYVKSLALLAGIRQHSADTVWEPTFGGKFPKKEYDAIIDQTQHVLNYLGLIAFTSRSFSPTLLKPPAPEQTPWLRECAAHLASLELTTQYHTTTSTLSLLSASITNGTPLPPYLSAPQAWSLAQKLESEGDENILSLKHVEEEGYAAFAVLQIASSLFCDDLRKLIEGVKDLVGEVGFDYLGHEAQGDEAEEWRKGKVD